MTQPQTDQEFAKAVGFIFGECPMCDLQHIQLLRRQSSIEDLSHEIAVRDRLVRRQRSRIKTWQLATFTAVVFGILMAIASLQRPEVVTCQP